MPCLPICHRERATRDPASPGVIDSAETICRSVYPSDRKGDGVKRSAIPASQLWAGQISVWRLSNNFSVPQLVELLEPIMVRNTGEKFDQIRAIRAGVIREFLVGDVRACSLLDECTMNHAGDKHPAHAQIAICEYLQQAISRDHPTFLAIQEGLKLIFERSPTAWYRPN